MRIQRLIAIWAAKLCSTACRLAGKQGVTLAGNFGRDADTIGAVAGVILGARYGASQMPAAWIEKTRYPSGTCLPMAKGIDLFAVADELAALVK